jgi:predicted Zn finger-like uncharacterized protein
MFTVCPKCALTLVVTAADLRVAQGYVRCGRCSSVFNALARLTDDRQAAESLSEAQLPPGHEEAPPPSVGADVSPPAAGSTEAPASVDALGDAPPQEQFDALAGTARPAPALDTSAVAESSAASTPAATAPAGPTPPAEHALPSGLSPTEESVPESALEFDATRTDVSAVFVEPPPHPEWTAATGSFKALIAGVQPDAPAPHESTPHVPQQSTPDASASAVSPETGAESVESAAQPAPAAQDTPTAPEASPATPPQAPSRHGTLHSHGRPPAAAAVRAPVSVRQRAATSKRKHDHAGPRDASPETMFGKARPTRARAPARLFGVGVGLAALALCAQVLHHYRDELAASPRLSRPLTALYAALGMPLVPRWDLHAYDVRQLGASVDPSSAGLITVRASIKNAAQQSQPLPLLRVTLQDRFGNRIAARDVAPHSYLPRAATTSAFLAAGQRIDAEMGFVDPGATAVGFEIDACLPARGGITCANDSATR